jgi:molybdenum cofactor biosynthesis enzyme MoaA
LEPSGRVTACCANSAYLLGRISQGDDSDSLRSIWQGARLQAQRDALDAGDFSLGCSECRDGVAAGNRHMILAREFDRYWDAAGSEYPSYIDFALSNTCNLQCVMCNGDLSSAIRSRREHRPPLESAYGDAFFEELVEFLPHLREASFKGGEPFLSREVRRVWDEMMRLGVRPRTTVTTNGTQWSDRVDQYVRWFGMHVILSVDGRSAATVESIRVGARYEELVENIGRFQRATEASGGSLVLNYCLMPQNWRELGAFLEDAERRGLWVHIIPVVAPAAFDLLQLPAGELTTIIDALERESTSRRGRLGRNEAAWSAQLDRLRRHLDSPLVLEVAPTVQVAEPQVRRRPGMAAPELEALASELSGWAGCAPLRIDARADVIEAVVVPPWATSWAASADLVGSSTDRILPSLAEWAGAPTPQVELRDGDAHMTARFELLRDGRMTPFRAVIASLGDARQAILVAPEGQRS